MFGLKSYKKLPDPSIQFDLLLVDERGKRVSHKCPLSGDLSTYDTMNQGQRRSSKKFGV